MGAILTVLRATFGLVAKVVWSIRSIPVVILDAFFLLLWLVYAALIIAILVGGYILYMHGGMAQLTADLLEKMFGTRFGVEVKVGSVSFGESAGALVLRVHDMLYINPPECGSAPYCMKVDLVELSVYARTVFSRVKVFEVYYRRPHFYYTPASPNVSNIDLVCNYVTRMQDANASPPPDPAVAAKHERPTWYRPKVLIHRIRWEAGDVTVLPEGRVIPMSTKTIREYGTHKEKEWRSGDVLKFMLLDAKSYVETGGPAGTDADSIPPSHVSDY